MLDPNTGGQYVSHEIAKHKAEDDARALFNYAERTLLADRSAQSLRLKFGATYTFLNQYATVTPDSVRHNQLSGRLDFTGAWTAYDRGSTAGSIACRMASRVERAGRAAQAGPRVSSTTHLRSHRVLV